MKKPLPVKLFIGMLSSAPELFQLCTDIFSKEYGPLDYESLPLPWNMTNYYRNELGDGIVRRFIFFNELIDPAELPRIKNFAIMIEKKFSIFSDNGLRRRINLDPGYVTEAKVVLATTKDYSHRIYIGLNIYAEVTLKYNIRNHQYTACDYTYPDYATDQYRALFGSARDLLRTTLHSPACRRDQICE